MTSTVRIQVANKMAYKMASARPAARIARRAAPSFAAAATSLIPLAAAVHAAPGPPVPDADHLLGMYGDPAAAAPYWRQQQSSDCGELAVADVVG
jgi:hypothetical protein